MLTNVHHDTTTAVSQDTAESLAQAAVNANLWLLNGWMQVQRVA